MNDVRWPSSRKIASIHCVCIFPVLQGLSKTTSTNRDDDEVNQSDAKRVVYLLYLGAVWIIWKTSTKTDPQTRSRNSAIAHMLTGNLAFSSFLGWATRSWRARSLRMVCWVRLVILEQWIGRSSSFCGLDVGCGGLFQLEICLVFAVFLTVL